MLVPILLPIGSSPDILKETLLLSGLYLSQLKYADDAIFLQIFPMVGLKLMDILSLSVFSLRILQFFPFYKFLNSMI